LPLKIGIHPSYLYYLVSYILFFFKLCDFILYIQPFHLSPYAHEKTRVVVFYLLAAAVLMGGTRRPHTCRRRNQTASATFVHDRPKKCGKTKGHLIFRASSSAKIIFFLTQFFTSKRCRRGCLQIRTVLRVNCYAPKPKSPMQAGQIPVMYVYIPSFECMWLCVCRLSHGCVCAG